MTVLLAVEVLAVEVLAVEAEQVTPGVLGFLVVAALGMATWLLLRSMTRHLGRVRVPPADDMAPGDQSEPDPQAPGRPAQ